MSLDAATLQLLQKALQVADLKQRVYANNIANVNTPGYKREDVSFAAVLQGQAAPTAQLGEQSIPINLSSASNMGSMQSWIQAQPRIVTDSSTTIDNNGNNVNIDAEMADLAENQIRYNTLVQDVQMNFANMTTAIEG